MMKMAVEAVAVVTVTVADAVAGGQEEYVLYLINNENHTFQSYIIMLTRLECSAGSVAAGAI